MKKNKCEQIKTRCTSELKIALEEMAAKMNTNVSTILLSAVETYLTPCEGSTPNSDFSHQVELNILRNIVYNAISIDSAIPEKSKERIRKEMEHFV